MSKKLRLSLSMDTDDDATITYDGKQYCRYLENLIISKNFNNVTEVANFLTHEIIVGDGEKASDFTKGWLIASATAILCQQEPQSVSGNQHYECYVFEIDACWYSKVRVMDRFDMNAIHRRKVELDGWMDDIFVATYLIGTFEDKREWIEDILEHYSDLDSFKVDHSISDGLVIVDDHRSYVQGEEFNSGIASSKEEAILQFNISEPETESEHNEWEESDENSND